MPTVRSLFNWFRKKKSRATVHVKINDSNIQDIAAVETEKFLHIRNLEIVRIEDAERTKLKDKQHLEGLHLSWSYAKDDYESIRYNYANDEKVLQGLQPPSNLKTLTISGYEGLRLPKWMGLSNCLPHMVELYFYECNNCGQLPALGMLPCLRILQIKGMELVGCLAEERYYQKEESSGNNKEMKEQGINNAATNALSSGLSLFPSLIELSLINMPSLEEFVAPSLHSLNCFPSLERLTVRGCVRLKSISLTACSSLRSLELRNANDEAVNSILASSGVERLTSLVSVSIQDSPEFKYFPMVLLQKDCPMGIQSLKFGNCSKFQGFRVVDHNNNNKEFLATLFSDTGYNSSISSLCSLKLTDCPAITRLPDLRNYTCLTQLWIEDCYKLTESFHYDLRSLHNLETLYVDGFIDLSKK